jgi:hypothetical protein
MIIFDLDGTLANCEHRRHLVDPSYNKNYTLRRYPTLDEAKNNKYIAKEWILIEKSSYQHCINGNHEKFNPDWPAFYEACDKDEIILPVAFQFYALREKFGICHPIQIWSGRCESVKGKTIDWLKMHFTRDIDWNENIKMRPIGDNTPDDQLKERWLDEAIAEGKKIDMVFDDRPKVVRMWRRRGIFVFDCNQTGKEF